MQMGQMHGGSNIKLNISNIRNLSKIYNENRLI
jgi:hypothetical protein